MNSAPLRIERSTWVSAAKLTTASQPCPAWATATASAMSPSWNSCGDAFEIGAVARVRELVEDDHVVAPVCEQLHEVRADEPRSAGDEDPHAESLARQARSPSRQCGRRGVSGFSERRTEYAGRGAGRSSSAVVDAADAAVDARLLEDRLGELGPGAVAVGGDVVRAVAAALRSREWPRPGARRRSGSHAGRRRPTLRPAHGRARASSARSSCPRARRATTTARSSHRGSRARPRASCARRRTADWARPTRRRARPSARRRRSRSRSRRRARPSATTSRVRSTLTRRAPSSSASAPSTSVYADVCSTRSGSASTDGAPDLGERAAELAALPR